MADETQGAQQAPKDTTDWKAKYEAMRQHSRDWESKAKANQSAADELEKLKADSQTEQQRAEERASRAEAELAQLKADAQRASDVREAADKAGIPLEVAQMLNGADAEELVAQAKALLRLMPVHPTRTDDGGTQSVAKRSNADRFADAFGEML